MKTTKRELDLMVSLWLNAYDAFCNATGDRDKERDAIAVMTSMTRLAESRGVTTKFSQRIKAGA
jgi:hypothetical protein